MLHLVYKLHWKKYNPMSETIDEKYLHPNSKCNKTDKIGMRL